MHGVGYDEIPVDVHGGLTFSNYAKELSWDEIPDGDTGYVVGFDTGHYGDDEQTWPESRVKEETESLNNQLQALTS